MNRRMVMIKFLTIRETAETGIFTEWGLRKMLKNGRLPGVFSGSRFYVNYSELEKMLEEQSKVNAGAADREQMA